MKPQETLEFKIIKTSEIFSFEPSINPGFDSKRKIGLKNLEV